MAIPAAPTPCSQWKQARSPASALGGGSPCVRQGRNGSETKNSTCYSRSGSGNTPIILKPPLVLDLAKTLEDRQVLEMVVAPQTFARPFVAPPGIPAERTAALRNAFNATVKDPAFIVEATKLQLEPDLVTAGQVEEILRGIYATPATVVARARAALQMP